MLHDVRRAPSAPRLARDALLMINMHHDLHLARLAFMTIRARATRPNEYSPHPRARSQLKRVENIVINS